MIEVNIVVCMIAEADTDDGLLVKAVGLPEENISDLAFIAGFLCSDEWP